MRKLWAAWRGEILYDTGAVLTFGLALYGGLLMGVGGGVPWNLGLIFAGVLVCLMLAMAWPLTLPCMLLAWVIWRLWGG